MESVKLLIDSRPNFGFSVLRWANGLNKILINFFLIWGQNCEQNEEKPINLDTTYF